MKKYIYLVYFFAFFFTFIVNLESSIQNSIVVKVDNKIITSYEVKNKILRTLII